jgi:hypothetical protein
VNDRKQLDDFGAFKASLLQSADRDEPAMPDVVRSRILAGTATAVVAATAAAVAAKAGAVPGGNSAIAVGKSALAIAAKWFGIGAVAAAASVGTLRVADTVVAAHSSGSTVVDPARPAGGAKGRTTRRPTEAHAPGVEDDSTSARWSNEEVVPPQPIASTDSRAERTIRTGPAGVAVEVAETTTQAAAIPHEVVATGASTQSLAPELALLDQARSALASGDAAGALAFLTKYGERFPRGGLMPEAMALRVQALYRQGNRAAGRELAERFLADYPSSPHAEPIRALAGPAHSSQ